uniref:Transposon Ty3-G Gag-Pol polyprotein n=1 Tax=Zeugodacus cucurbitae TaxID=28588 RepID=A0A0A1XBC7_ZEUCU
MTPFELLTGVKMRTPDDLNIKQLIDEEIRLQYQEGRDEIRQHAKEQILKIQTENKKTYNLRRKPANQYTVNDLVAVKRTQFGGGLKLKPKYLGPYQIIKVKTNNTYDVKKVGEAEGPNQTTTCAEFIKPWSNFCNEDDDAFEVEYDAGWPRCGIEQS